MKFPVNHLLLLQKTCFALALSGTGAFAVAAPSDQDLVDARQEAQIWTTYALSPYLRASTIEVSVTDGKATLSGSVEDEINKDLARQIALGVDGIESVKNDIVVAADFVPATRDPAERTYGEVIDDAGITTALKSKLLWNKHTDGLQTEVDTRLGVVTLRGTADSAASKELAGTMARNTHGVHSVDNQLVVSAAAPSLSAVIADQGEETGRHIADSWITTKVKSTFIYSSNVDGGDISVSTLDGVVTLSGTLDSGVERALAVELAQNVRGVKDVNATQLEF